MAGRENDAAKRLVLADHGTRRGGRKNTVLPDHHPPETHRGRHAQDRLDGYIIEIAPIASQNQRLPLLSGKRVEDGLDEILQIARLGEHLDLLAQPGSTRLLP